MKVLILNSGMGTRMGVLTSEHPKCMSEISADETILSRQLRLVAEAGIKDVVAAAESYGVSEEMLRGKFQERQAAKAAEHEYQRQPLRHLSSGGRKLPVSGAARPGV